MTDPFTNNGQLGSNLTLSGREIDLKAETNNSGAITELTWNGFQFINAKTKDRALQTQVSLDNFGQTDFATLNEAGAASQNFADPSSARYVEDFDNPRQLLTKSFLAYDTPLSYDGLTLFCSGNILEKKIDMDFLGDPHIVRATWRIDQYASTKQGAFRWGINLSLNEDLTERYLYDPANDASPQAQTDGDVVSTFLGGPIAANTAGTYAIGLFHAPSQGGNSFTTTFTGPGVAEGGDPKLTTNQSLVLDTEASLGNLGSAAGTRHVTRYICVGTLAEVQAAFDFLEPYVTELLRGPDDVFDPTVVTDIVVQQAPLAIRRNVPFRLTLAAVNGLGARVLDFSDTATITVLDTDVNLTGTLSKSFVNGLVEFDDLELDRAGAARLRFGTTGAVGSYIVVVNNPTPSLGSLIPDSLPNSTVAPGIVTATGVDFRPGIEARIQGVSVPTTRNSETSLTFEVPQEFLTEGFRSVSVLNPAPGGGLSNSLTLAITDGFAPLISEVNVELLPDGVSAVISWETDERASTQIQVVGAGLGTNGYAVDENNTNETRLRNHSVLVENLEDGETYTYYISATDDAGNRTQPQLRTFVTSDTTPPVFIGGVEADVFLGGVTLSWSTNEATAATIRITGSDGSDVTETISDQLFSHSKTVTGLRELVEYTATVTATDVARNTATSSVQFQTPETPVEPLNIVDGPTVTNITDSRATISWELNRPAGGEVVITDSEGNQVFDSQGNLNFPSRTDHEITIGGPPGTAGTIYLAPETLYYFRVRGSAQDPVGTYTSDVASFTTEATDDSLDPLQSGDEVVRLQIEVPPGKTLNDKIMVHSVVPLLEQADLSLEWVYVDLDGTEIPVQREFVSYNPEHVSGTPSVNAVEVIFPVTIPFDPFGNPGVDRFEVSLVASDAITPGDDLDAETLEGLEMVMGMPDGLPDQQVDIFTATNTRSLKLGEHCVERRFYNRLDGISKTLGVHTYVTQYDPSVDANVYVRMLITNSHVDPDADGPHYGTPGKIFFETLTLDATALSVGGGPTNRPLIHRYPDTYCVTQNYNGDLQQLRLIDSVVDEEDAVLGRFTFRSVDGVRSEVWHAGGQRIEHVAIGQNGQTDDDKLYQTAVLEYQNIAWPISGRNYGRNARWWGPAYVRSGELPDTYQLFSGTSTTDAALTGADSYDKHRMAATARVAKQILRSNNGDAIPSADAAAYTLKEEPLTQELGCWSPGYRANGSYDDIEMMSIYETQPRIGHTAGWSYWADLVLQRHHMTMFDENGVYVTAKVWRGATENNTPFAVYSNDGIQTRGLAPFFTNPAAPSLYDQPEFNQEPCPYDINDDYVISVASNQWITDFANSQVHLEIDLADYKFGPNIEEVVVTRVYTSGLIEAVDGVEFTYLTSTDKLRITVPSFTIFNGEVTITPSATWDKFTPISAGAIPRLLRCYLGMINTCNASLYKDLLEFQAEYYLLSEDRFTTDLGTNGTVGQIAQDFGSQVRENKGVMLLDSNGDPITPYVWGRDKAWANFTIATHHMHTPVQTLRDENILHFEALEDVISRVMPGGTQPTYDLSSTARRIAQHIVYTQEEYRDGRADLAETRYSISEAPSPNITAGPDLTTVMSYQPGDPSTLIEAGVTSANYATLEIGVFHDFTGQRFPIGPDITLTETNTGALGQVTLGSILQELYGNYVYYETADNNMLCHMYYAVGEALRPTYAVNGDLNAPTDELTPPGRLFIYAYEMILAREKHQNYYATASTSLGTYGGFNRRGASGVVDSSAETGLQVANLFYNELPEPPYATLYRNEPLKEHSFYPELSAAYAAQRLRAEPLSLNSTSVMAGLRVNYDPEYYAQYLTTSSFSAYEDKISSAAGKWSALTAPGAEESWPMASPWMAEVQHQIANAGAPTVNIQWSGAEAGIVEGTTKTYRLFTLSGLTTTEDVIIDLLPAHTTSQRPIVTVNGIAIADDINNQEPISVTLEAGRDTVELTVAVADNNVFDGPASINITASVDPTTGGPGFIVGEATRTIAIQDDDFEDPQTASFERPAYNVLEGNTQDVAIKTQNPIATSETLDILVTTAGSAVEGTDYNLTGDISAPDANGVRTVTLRGDTPGGDGKTATFTVEALSDSISEGDEQLTFTIVADQNSPYGLGTNVNTTVIITEETGGGENDGLLIAKGIQTGDGGVAGYNLPRMWSTTLPMHTPSPVLPQAYMIHPDDPTREKVQADVFGITKNQSGEWMHVAVSCPLDHASGAWSVPDDGSINSGAPANPAITVGLGAADSTHSSANNFYDLFVTRCSLEIKLANVVTPYEFILGDQNNGGLGAPEVEYSGLYNRRTTYYGRFSNPNVDPSTGGVYGREDQCLVCKVTVDERTDAPVALVDVSIQNSVLTGDYEIVDPYEEDPAADGTVYFDYIKFKTNTPGSGEEVRVTTNAPRESTGPVTGTNEKDFWIVKPMSTTGGQNFTYPDEMTGTGLGGDQHGEPDQQHGMLPGHQMLRRLALYRSTITDVNNQITGGMTSDVAKDFARRYDWGWTVGEIGYQNGGWSLENYYIPDWRIFRDQMLSDGGGGGEPGLRGLILQAEATEAEALTELISAEIPPSVSNSISNLITRDYGWAKPGPTQIDPSTPANLLYFEIPFFGGLNAQLIAQERITDRQGIAAFSLKTRRPITPKSMMPPDGTELPYGHDPEKPWSYIPAWLNLNPALDGATNDNPSANRDTWDLAPTDLPWNTHDFGKETFYLQGWQASGLNWQEYTLPTYGPLNVTESYESIYAYGPLYLCNDGGSRTIIEIEGASRFIMSEVHEPAPYRTSRSLDTVSLRHLDLTRNNTLVKVNGATVPVTGRNLNFGFGYIKAVAQDSQTLLDNTAGSSNIGTGYYAHGFLSVAHYYAVTDAATRDEITDGTAFNTGEIGDGLSANFPHLVGLYLGRKLSPCGSLDLSFTNIDRAYGRDYPETGWDSPPFTSGTGGATTYNGATVPIWSDLGYVVFLDTVGIAIRRGLPPGLVKADGSDYPGTVPGTDLTHNNIYGRHYGWASTRQTAYGMRLAMAMPRVFSTLSWTGDTGLPLYNNVWKNILRFVDIYGDGTVTAATPGNDGKFGAPFNKKNYVDHTRSRPTTPGGIGLDGGGTQGINNDPTSELQGGRKGWLVQWPANAPALNDTHSAWTTFAFNAQAYAVDAGTFGYGNIGMKNTRYEGSRDVTGAGAQPDRDQRVFFEAHYFEGVGTDDFRERHFLLPVIGFMRASRYGE